MTPALSIRASRFLFAPLDPVWVARYRFLFATGLAVVFFPYVPRASGALRWRSGGVELVESVFLSPPHLVAAAVALIAFGLSFRPRWTGGCLLFLLLPLTFVASNTTSRELLFASLGLLWLASGPPAGAGATPIWPIRLMQLQVSALYGWNALAKTTPDYLSGAVLMAMSKELPNFLADLSGGFLQIGPLVLPVAFCAWVSVAVEAALAIGLWFRRTRWLVAALGVAFHLSLSTIIDIGFLDWAAVLLYPTFLLPLEATSSVGGAPLAEPDPRPSA